MRLSQFSDLALRLLIFAAQGKDRHTTIEEVARYFDVSKAHLMKVTSLLARDGFIRATRGRRGGLTLAKPAHEIRIGDVIRITEVDFAMVSCMSGHECRIAGACTLPRQLELATEAFLATLNQCTLADICPPLTIPR